MSVDELIARLERASEGSRDLDAEIARRVGLRDVHFDGDFEVGVSGGWFYATGMDSDGGPWEFVPAYTTSIDDAVSSLPAGWRWSRFCRRLGGTNEVKISFPVKGSVSSKEGLQQHAHHRDLKIALVMAGLKARALKARQ